MAIIIGLNYFIATKVRRIVQDSLIEKQPATGEIEGYGAVSVMMEVRLD